MMEKSDNWDHLVEENFLHLLKYIYIYILIKFSQFFLLKFDCVLLSQLLWCFTIIIFQAAMSSDIAIAQFRFLERLLLVHGHWCYRRISSMVKLLCCWIYFILYCFIFTIHTVHNCIETNILFLFYRYATSSTRTLHSVLLCSYTRHMHHFLGNQHIMIGICHFIMSSSRHSLWLLWGCLTKTFRHGFVWRYVHHLASST